MAKKILIIICVLLISACGNYKPRNSDIVNTHGDIRNADRMNEFLLSIESNIKDQVRVVNYTHEGDPIIHDLEYDGQILTSIINTEYDEFGEKKIDKDTCEEIIKVKKGNSTVYHLAGCSSEGRLNDVLTIYN